MCIYRGLLQDDGTFSFFLRQLAVELKKQAEERKEAEEAFYRNQELQMEAEKQRRDLILLEEQKLADQRVRSVVCVFRHHQRL